MGGEGSIVCVQPGILVYPGYERSSRNVPRPILDGEGPAHLDEVPIRAQTVGCGQCVRTLAGVGCPVPHRVLTGTRATVAETVGFAECGPEQCVGDPEGRISIVRMQHQLHAEPSVGAGGIHLGVSHRFSLIAQTGEYRGELVVSVNTGVTIIIIIIITLRPSQPGRPGRRPSWNRCIRRAMYREGEFQPLVLAESVVAIRGRSRLGEMSNMGT